MKLLQQLDEQASELHDVQQLIAAVKQAAPFFKQRGDDHQWLYRGVAESMYPQDALVATYEPRTDRPPKDTVPMLHRALDRKFLEVFNIPFRSEGLFVTGNDATTITYGKTAIILPEGNFRFCWGREVSDAYAHFELNESFGYIQHYAAEMGESFDNYPPINSTSDFIEFIETHTWARQLFDQWLDGFFEDARYTDKKLSQAVDSGNEIMVKCSNYAIVANKGSIPSYYIDAAEHILSGSLYLSGHRPDIKQFINAIADKVVH